MIVKVICPKDWFPLAENAHKICFDEIYKPENCRIDFALLVVKEESPCAYVTCREVDNETIYWQYGGAMPNIKDTVNSWSAYRLMTNKINEMGYKRIYTLVKNDNFTMMKFAIKMGYKIIGTRTVDNEIFLEHKLEF